ncbi:hypothetical protein M5K25_013943 [Dendrobium thyrsiflorum]|uniref:Uncharacterized protein n=1 Tax=Dendrobium thyrsiflorum TaxID=117978 RepID=A0ABD0V1I0_DENTH
MSYRRPKSFSTSPALLSILPQNRWRPWTKRGSGRREKSLDRQELLELVRLFNRLYAGAENLRWGYH